MRSSGGRPYRPVRARRALRDLGRGLLWVPIALALAAPAAGQSPPGGPPPAVTTAVVESRPVAPSAEFIGRIEAIQSFEARARVEGFLQQVAFKEGQDVHKGDLLFVIEPGPYQAALDSAQAQQARAEAAQKAAERAFQRAAALQQHGNVSQAAYDQALAARDQAAADVAVAKAAVETARLNLGYTRIESPIDGRIGAVAVTQGNLVGPSSGVLATVVQLDPIRVVFSPSDRDLLAVQQNLGLQSPQELVERFVPKLKLPNGAAYPEDGHIEFIDNRIDPNTGTVAVRAIFPNPQKILLPGMFASVVVQPGNKERRPVVPIAAVQQDSQGRYVMVLDQDNRVQQRRIETGMQIDQQWVVQKGLQEGETVVVQGQQKIRPGMTVQPTPAEAQVRG